MLVLVLASPFEARNKEIKEIHVGFHFPPRWRQRNWYRRDRNQSMSGSLFPRSESSSRAADAPILSDRRIALIIKASHPVCENGLRHEFTPRTAIEQAVLGAILFELRNVPKRSQKIG
jgi:hypothetical protein